MEIRDNLDVLFERLEKFFRTETIVGKPIEVGEITLIPVIDIGFGLGSGKGAGKDNKGNDGKGGGAGVGAKITPNAILVIKGQEISLIGLKHRKSLEKVLEMVPEIISQFYEKKQNEEENETTA